MATPAFTSCASGCGNTNVDPNTLKKCSRCHVVSYCNRDCQAFHWKNGHKEECFPLQNGVVQFCQVCSANDETPVLEALQIAERALYGNPGCALFMGTNADYKSQGLPKYEVITDIWSTRTSDNSEPLAPDLYVPHVPPAFLCKAEDNAMSNPGHYLPREEPPHEIKRILSDAEDVYLRCMNSRVVSSDIFNNALTAVFTRSDEVISFLNQALDSTVWSQQIQIPQHILQQAESLVGKTLSLDGIEMVYITPPVICFSNPTKTELCWLNSQPLMFPLIKVPVVTYRCVDQGWQLTRFSPCLNVPFSLNPSVNFTSEDTDAVFLRVFVAAAEFGDVAALYSAWAPAEAFAIFARQEHVFIKAARKLLAQLTQIHPLPKREEAYFMYQIGALHESRASWLQKDGEHEELVKEELLSAARCYRLAAERTQQFYHSSNMRSSCYGALGGTLLRLDDIEMSKRAFIWALTDPLVWCGQSPQSTGVIGNLKRWCEFQHLNRDERNKAKKMFMKGQRKELKNSKSSESRHYSENCRNCEKIVHETRWKEYRCGRCYAPYCSRECQRSDWPVHRSQCSEQAEGAPLRNCLDFEVGSCTDSTRAALNAVNWNDMVFTMRLSERTQIVDRWKETRPETVEPEYPRWLLD